MSQQFYGAAEPAADGGTGDAYVEAMRDLLVDEADMEGSSGAYDGHAYAQGIGGEPNEKQLRRIAQEIVSFEELPLSPSSSVFVRVDESRIDVQKALITGPEGTPYAGGCFLFHMLLRDFPEKSPDIQLMTTGKGTHRFNPNLYTSGKVCLSMLGTWPGRPEERWHADTSTVMQLFVSIQALILVPQPFYNEPGYERKMGTPEGNLASAEYNAMCHYGTVKWAMLDVLRNPPGGFEEVVERHFWLRRDYILALIDSWAAVVPRSPVMVTQQERLVEAVAELKRELGALIKPPGL